MLQQFKSMNDLVAYLEALEKRIQTLETENRDLQALTPLHQQDGIDENALQKVVLDYFPNTNLIDPNFFKRAFAVWGHFFVANLIVGIILGIGYAGLALVLFGSVLGNLFQNP
jgi:hypothetical protein